jgi:ribosomal protein S12 methylthiotransferase accessory factor
MRPHFARLGITRIARQTGLDVLGIPCFAATRPNSKSLAANQGKGITDDLAMASAVMEAAEYAVAENPSVRVVLATLDDLAAGMQRAFVPARLLPMGTTIGRRQTLRWVEGRCLSSREMVMVPLDVVRHNGVAVDLPGVCQVTNGLASGNTNAEAVFHGLCELVERDAATMWSLMEADRRLSRCIDPESLEDPVVDDMVGRFANAGLVLRLFDQTSDVGVPTILAVCGPSEQRFAKHYDIAVGSGTHPDPVRAALRAITEAAQTRVTAIAGARDDHVPGRYRRPASDAAFELLTATPRPIGHHDHPETNDAAELTAHVLQALADAGCDDVVVVELGGGDLDFSVVRVLSALLEDRGPNANWRPGPRALANWSAFAS